MTEHLVIVELVDGYADTSLVHQPAVHRQNGNGGPRLRFDDYEWAPTRRTSACGIHGSVYNHAGLLEDAPMCTDCQVAMLVGEA